MTGFEMPEDRCVILARYMLEENCTVRGAAARFGVSKSTVHKDLTEKLAARNAVLFSEVRKLLQKNKEERHLRGGEATKRKYAERKGVGKSE